MRQGGDSAAATYVAARFDKAAGTLTLVDLVQFVIGVEDLEAKLNEALPEVAGVLQWFEDVLGVPPAEVARQLLVQLVKPTPARMAELLDTLATVAKRVVENELLPHLIDPLKQAHPDDLALALFLDEIVAPVLISLPVAILPNIAHLGSPDAALRFREAISAVLFQTLQRLVFTGVDVIVERALRDGEQAMRDLGRVIVQTGPGSSEYNAMTTLASQSELGFVLSPADAQTLLGFGADIARLLNDRVRPALLGATGRALDLGLAVPASREIALRTIAGTDDPPERADLDNVLWRVADSAWEVVAFVIPRGLELIARRIAETAVAFATAIWEGAKAVVQAIFDAIAWLGTQLEELRRQLTVLVNQIAQLAAAVADWIQRAADHARTLAGEVINRIRDWGLHYIDDFIDWLPDWLKWLGEGVRAVYNAAFDGVIWVLDGVLGFLSSVGGWVRDACRTRG